MNPPRVHGPCYKCISHYCPHPGHTHLATGMSTRSIISSLLSSTDHLWQRCFLQSDQASPSPNLYVTLIKSIMYEKSMPHYHSTGQMKGTACLFPISCDGENNAASVRFSKSLDLCILDLDEDSSPHFLCGPTLDLHPTTIPSPRVLLLLPRAANRRLPSCPPRLLWSANYYARCARSHRRRVSGSCLFTACTHRGVRGLPRGCAEIDRHVKNFHPNAQTK